MVCLASLFSARGGPLFFVHFYLLYLFYETQLCVCTMMKSRSLSEPTRGGGRLSSTSQALVEPQVRPTVDQRNTVFLILARFCSVDSTRIGRFLSR